MICWAIGRATRRAGPAAANLAAVSADLERTRLRGFQGTRWQSCRESMPVAVASPHQPLAYVPGVEPTWFGTRKEVQESPAPNQRLWDVGQGGRQTAGRVRLPTIRHGLGPEGARQRGRTVRAFSASMKERACSRTSESALVMLGSLQPAGRS